MFDSSSPTFETAANPPWPVRQYNILFILFLRYSLLFFALLHLSSYIVRPPVNTLITDLFDLWSPPYSWRVTNSIDYQLSGNDSLAFSRRKLFAVRFKSVTIVIIGNFDSSWTYSWFFRFVADDVVVLSFYSINHAK